MVEKYFTHQNKIVGNSDSDKLKVVSHDLKQLLRKFAFEESFSKDSGGGGPE